MPPRQPPTSQASATFKATPSSNTTTSRSPPRSHPPTACAEPAVSPDEPAASKPMGLMRNDHSCCHGSNSEDEGSRGGSASLPTHYTSPFQSPRGRMSVASSHVPQPCPCRPRSRWGRCTIRHIRGAAGSQRRSSHRSAPQSAST